MSQSDPPKKEEAAETAMTADGAPEDSTLASGKVKTATRKLEQENLQKESTLAEAKDRAQLTATTAMSIVNVALLKELLDRGSEGNQYYYYVLTLIALSLAFQVVVGALAMMVSHMRSYYKKYGDDMCSDCLSNVCWVHIRQKKKPGSSGMHDDCEGQHGLSCACCPCYITSNIYPHWEYTTLEQYDKWQTSATNAEVRAAEADIHLQYLKQATKEATEKLQALEEKKEKGALTATEFDTQYQKIDGKLAAANKSKLDYLKLLKEQELSEGRGDVLEEKANKIMKDRIMKQISFWQNIINYLLYFVFIFNAFIAGLGLFGSTTESTPAAPNITIASS